MNRTSNIYIYFFFLFLCLLIQYAALLLVLCLLWLLCTFYVRADTVIYHNEINKLLCIVKEVDGRAELQPSFVFRPSVA